MNNLPTAYSPVPGPPVNPAVVQPNRIDILDALTDEETTRRCALYPELMTREAHLRDGLKRIAKLESRGCAAAQDIALRVLAYCQESQP